jgi:hypothetical protein
MMLDNSTTPWRQIGRRISVVCGTAARRPRRSAVGSARAGAGNASRRPLRTARLSCLCALGCVLMFSGCAPGPEHPQSRPDPVNAAAASPVTSVAQMCRPERALLVPPRAPDCGFGWSNLKTVDPDQWARLKVESERKCYQNAEKIVRERLRLLQASLTCEADTARQ